MTIEKLHIQSADHTNHLNTYIYRKSGTIFQLNQTQQFDK